MYRKDRRKISKGNISVKAAVAIGVVILAGGTVAGILAYQHHKEDEPATEETSVVSPATETVSDTADTTTDTQAETTATETTEAKTTEEPVSYASQYLAILRENESAIREYNQYRYPIGDDIEADSSLDTSPVAVRDITGDGVPELIYVACQPPETGTESYTAALCIYTIEDQTAKQIYYEESWDVQAGGGSHYGLFQIDGDVSLYGFNGMADDFTDENYFRLDVQADGTLAKTELMTRYKSPNEDYTETITECTLNKTAVDEATFQTALDAVSSKMKLLFMYNNAGGFDSNTSSAMRNAEFCGMTYDEAYALLSEDTTEADTSTSESQTQASKGTTAAMPFTETQTLYFTSGVGAWQTELTLNPDGTFSGQYQDSDMGASGEGYDSTVYISTFRGSFANVQKIDDYTYSMELSELTTEETQDSWIEQSEDGTKTLYQKSAPYGIDGGTTFYLYLPGSKISSLPEGYTSWLMTDETTLGGYGLYNIDQENGFIQ